MSHHVIKNQHHVWCQKGNPKSSLNNAFDERKELDKLTFLLLQLKLCRLQSSTNCEKHWIFSASQNVQKMRRTVKERNRRKEREREKKHGWMRE
jgi:hypothetical protein